MRGILLCGLLLLAAGLPAQDEPQAPASKPQSNPENLEARKQAARTQWHNPENDGRTSWVDQHRGMDVFQMREMLRIQAAYANHNRKVVAVPAAALGDLSKIATSAGGNPSSPDSSAGDIAPAPSNLLQNIVLFLTLLGLSLLAAVKFVPGFALYLSGLVNSPALMRSAGLGRSVISLSEDASVEEFQATFHIRKQSYRETEPAVEPAETPFSQAAECLRKMHALLERVRQSPAGAARQDVLHDLKGQICQLKKLADNSELVPMRQMTCAVEMLNRQLIEKSENVNSSTLRTMGLGLEILEELCKPGLNPNLLSEPPLRLLVVDDEAFSRYALSITLKRTLNAPEVADNGVAALKLIGEQTYDLIFLDIQMPGMDGFELCSKIHETPNNRSTPVVFVTGMADFDTRSKSILCGGRDLVAKPFLTFELTVKALTMVTHERLRGRGRLAEVPASEPLKAAEAATPATPAPAVKDAKLPDSEHKSAPSPAAPAKMAEEKPFKPGSEKETPKEFLAHAGAQAVKFQEILEYLAQTGDEKSRQELISDLFQRVHALALRAEAARHSAIAQLCAAVEGLLKKLLPDSKHLNASVIQTLHSAASLLGEFSARGILSNQSVEGEIRALAVDDDPISLRSICSALQLRFPKPDTAPGGEPALKLISEKPFDIIFLDVQMPGMDGFEVCKKIRENAAHAQTPVIFVTSSDDPAARAKAADCGGNDFITKPFLNAELSLKALAFVFRNRLCNSASPVATRENIESMQPAAV